MRKQELVTTSISILALIISVTSLYFQLYRKDKLILRVNPIKYSSDKGLYFDLAVSNLGNASGLVKLNRLSIMDSNSDTKGKIIHLDKSMIVKAGEIEPFKYDTPADPFYVISGDNSKHNILLNVTYINSDARSKSANIRLGFLCLSTNKKTVYTELGNLPLEKLPDDSQAYLLSIEGNTVTFGDPRLGLTAYKPQEPKR